MANRAVKGICEKDMDAESQQGLLSLDWGMWPLELWDHMLAFVGKKDIMHASLVSHAWRFGALASFRQYKVNSHCFVHMPYDTPPATHAHSPPL
mgnify:CR=1 FL=1